MPEHTPKDLEAIMAEQVRMLRGVEERSRRSVTGADLAALTDTLVGGLKKVEERLDVFSGQLGVHGVAITALDKRVTRVEGVPLSRSIAPRSPGPFLNAEQTAGGGIRLGPSELQGVIQRVEEIEAERDKAKDAERIAQERQGAVTDYSRKQAKRFKQIIAILSLPCVGAVVHFILGAWSK